VSEVAHEVCPDARIVHVDNDPVVYTHSYLAISSLRLPGHELPEQRATTIEGEELMTGALGSIRWREDSQILSWFGKWKMVEPGLVPLADWRPAMPAHSLHPEVHHSFSGGLARKELPGSPAG
jgi:hypothetical protein